MFLEFSEVPTVHLFKSELLLEHRVDVEARGRRIVSNVNNVSLISCHNDSAQVAALVFKASDLFSGVRESY